MLTTLSLVPGHAGLLGGQESFCMGKVQRNLSTFAEKTIAQAKKALNGQQKKRRRLLALAHILEIIP